MLYKSAADRRIRPPSRFHILPVRTTAAAAVFGRVTAEAVLGAAFPPTRPFAGDSIPAGAVAADRGTGGGEGARAGEARIGAKNREKDDNCPPWQKGGHALDENADRWQ